ncbi:hypothetical protein KCP73_05445 [Salmonella enterica subsp. enterica]|nr:hypothetical protein KCP73_05445 [Salmonella enterica subsp. enterica]
MAHGRLTSLLLAGNAILWLPAAVTLTLFFRSFTMRRPCGWKTGHSVCYPPLSGSANYRKLGTNRSAGERAVSTSVYLAGEGIVTDAAGCDALFCVFCVGYSRPATVSRMR